MATATTKKPTQKPAKAVKQPVSTNGAHKANGSNGNGATAEKQVPRLSAAVQKAIKDAGFELKPVTNPERSAAAKSAWETIRANRAAGFKTTAEREAAEAAKAPKKATAKPAKKAAKKAAK